MRFSHASTANFLIAIRVSDLKLGLSSARSSSLLASSRFVRARKKREKREKRVQLEIFVCASCRATDPVCVSLSACPVRSLRLWPFSLELHLGLIVSISPSAALALPSVHHTRFPIHFCTCCILHLLGSSIFSQTLSSLGQRRNTTDSKQLTRPFASSRP